MGCGRVGDCGVEVWTWPGVSDGEKAPRRGPEMSDGVHALRRRTWWG
jgi:hypothetical protein